MFKNTSLRSYLHRSLVVASVLLFSLVPPGISAAATVSGHFSQRWGDSFSPARPPVERYFLTDASGDSRDLLLSAALLENPVQLRGFNGRAVTVTPRPSPARLNSGPDSPLYIDDISLNEAALSAARVMGVSGSQPWVSIMCKFADIHVEPKNLDYFRSMYSSAYPGLDHYWREASYGTVNIGGSSAHGWYTLPRERSYYLGGGKLDFDKITGDCIGEADADVYFPAYVGINLMFNADLDGYAWGGTDYLNVDGLGKSYRMTWEPPWGYSDITVIAHEMGHGFGMPHSSGDYGRTYDNVWDVMSNAWANCSAGSHPTYGCLGQHTIGYHRLLVGWLPAAQIYTFDGTARTITLERITQPLSTGYLLAKVPIGDSARRFYTVELRQRQGYDEKLASEAVIIHEVDTGRQRPAHIVDIDGDGDTGDGGARWSVGETFEDRANNICISVLAGSGSTSTLRIGCESSLNSGKATTAPINLLLLR